MPITLEQAKALQFGDYIHSNHFTMADNSTPVRWRVNGMVKRWKRDPDRIQIPVKYGLYDHAYLCHGEIADKVYMRSITLELENFELTEKAAVLIIALIDKGYSPQAYNKAIKSKDKDAITLTHPSNWMNEIEKEF
jgi:hypothetical protein